MNQNNEHTRAADARERTLASTNVATYIVLGSALLASIACGCDVREARVAGTAVDAQTLKPLSNVTITWNGQSTTTASDGAYAFTMPVGVQALHASRKGAAFSTLVVVAHTKWMEGLPQTYDVLIPAEESESAAAGWTVAFLGADFTDVPEGDFGSGLLTTNRDGGDARFLELTSGFAQLPQWSADGQLLYFADIEAPGHVFRHDVAANTTKPLNCDGFTPSDISMLCVSPDGDTAVVSTSDRTVVLSHLNGECDARAVAREFVPADPPRCSFDQNGNAYVAAKRDPKSPSGREGQLQVLDTRAETATPTAMSWVSDWNLNYARVLPDGRLLVERKSDDDQRETWLLDLAAQTSSQVSDTPAPVDLADEKLYYISDGRALRVRLLDSGREATLVNGAVFATPMPAR